MEGMGCEPAIDTFIGKINSAGEWQWVRTIGSDPKIGYDYEPIGGRRVTIAVFVFSSNLGIDSEGNILFTTGSKQNLFFSNSNININGELPVLAKISSNGEWINASKIKIPSEEGAILEEYQLNYNQDSIDFTGKIEHLKKIETDPINVGIPTIELRVSEAAIGKMNLNGEFTKVIYIENRSRFNSPTIYISDTKLDSEGNMLILGKISNTLPKNGLNRGKPIDTEKLTTIQIGDQILNLDYTPNPNSDGGIIVSKPFILKVDNALEIQNLIGISGDNFSVSNLEIDNEFIYLAGVYDGNAIIQGNILTPHIYSRNNKTGFVLKLSESGNLQWIKTFSNPYTFSIIDNMFLERNKYITIVGSILSAFGESYFGNFELTSYGGVLPLGSNDLNADVFAVELSPNGEWVSAITLGDSKIEILRKAKIVNDKLLIIIELLEKHTDGSTTPTISVWDMSLDINSNILGDIIRNLFRH